MKKIREVLRLKAIIDFSDRHPTNRSSLKTVMEYPYVSWDQRSLSGVFASWSMDG